MIKVVIKNAKMVIHEVTQKQTEGKVTTELIIGEYAKPSREGAMSKKKYKLDKVIEIDMEKL